MKRTKTIISTVLCMFLLSLVMAGCTKTEPTAKPDGDDSVPETFALVDDVQTPAVVNTSDTDAVQPARDQPTADLAPPVEDKKPSSSSDFSYTNDGTGQDDVVDVVLLEAIRSASEQNGWPSKVDIAHSGEVGTLFWSCDSDDLYLSMTIDHITEPNNWYDMTNHFTMEYDTREDLLGKDALLKGSREEGKALFGSVDGNTTHLYYAAMSEEYFVKCVMNTYDGRDYEAATEQLNELLAVVRPQ